ncbi:hypothetical protein ACJX0J_023626, partial [Zea mays]
NGVTFTQNGPQRTHFGRAVILRASNLRICCFCFISVIIDRLKELYTSLPMLVVWKAQLQHFEYSDYSTILLCFHVKCFMHVRQNNTKRKRNETKRKRTTSLYIEHERGYFTSYMISSIGTRFRDVTALLDKTKIGKNDNKYGNDNGRKT